MPAQQTAQEMRHSPEGSLWHFSAKSKDGKKRENFRRTEGSEYIRVSKRTTGELGDREYLGSTKGCQLQHGASTRLPLVAKTLI